MRFKPHAVACLLWTMIVPSAFAGTISGVVFARFGDELQTIPGATVTLKGGAVHSERTLITDSEGRYRFLDVPPGEAYVLKAELEGLWPWPMSLDYLYSTDDATVDLELDASFRECSLGRRSQVPTPAPGPGVFRVRHRAAGHVAVRH